MNFSKAHGRTIASPVCYEFSCRPTADLFSAINSHFINRVYEIVRRLGKEPTFWIEAWLGTNLPKGAIVQNWYTGDFTYKIAASGHRVIHSPEGNYSDGWYLDGLNQGWESMYLVDPGRNISEELLPQVLGGEGCMWGETVDSSNVELTVWPRTAAIAERLWSPGSVNSTDAAKWRMENFRCLLLERGIASDVVGEVGRQGLQGPGSCTQGEPYILDRAPCIASGRCQDDHGRWWDLEPLVGIHRVGEPATGVTYTFALWQNIDPVPVICDRTHSKPVRPHVHTPLWLLAPHGRYFLWSGLGSKLSARHERRASAVGERHQPQRRRALGSVPRRDLPAARPRHGRSTDLRTDLLPAVPRPAAGLPVPLRRPQLGSAAAVQSWERERCGGAGHGQWQQLHN